MTTGWTVVALEKGIVIAFKRIGERLGIKVREREPVWEQLRREGADAKRSRAKDGEG